MTKPISKADIDRLGDKIRLEKNAVSEETLNDLQNYRTSHREILSQSFTFLCDISRKIHPSTIVTYRIKRFESIIGKLNRYPDMRFSRMWDIGGCRCITRNNYDVYKIKGIILNDADFEIVKEYDYIKQPQKDGYKSLHLFIKRKANDKIIELQLRNQVDHNWATLVEITDLLFDSKLKEFGENKDLLKFHLLLSNINNLTIQEKKQIAIIIKQYNYFEKLSEVFSRNYIRVRKQWFDIESQPSHKFFLIETTKDDVPKISSYKSAIEAEDQYFNVYKSNQNANIVLTHLLTPNYNQISIAYSNYILTFHTFLNECYSILESLVFEALEKGNYIDYIKMYHLYNSLVFNHIRNLLSEIKGVRTYSGEPKNIKNRSKKSTYKKNEKDWISDINKQIYQFGERGNRLRKKFRISLQSNFFKRIIILRISKFIENSYKNKMKKLSAKTE